MANFKIVLFACWLIPASVWAQTADMNHSTRKDWFIDYETNNVAVIIPLSKQNIEELERRAFMLRFYQLFIVHQQNTPSRFLHVGFFSSTEEALQAKSDFFKVFRGVQVERISESLHDQVAKGGSSDLTLLNGALGDANESQEILFSKAKQAYVSKNYDRAISLYRLLALWAPEQKAAWAQELLALSYTRSGDWKRAEEAYEKWLVRFSENSAKPRITRRLTILQSASQALRAPLRKPNAKRKIFARGSIGQTYRSATRKTTDSSSERILDLLSSNWDFRAATDNEKHSANLRFTGYSLRDQLNSETKTRIRRANINYQHKATEIETRLGRQRNSDTGVFTYFDGVSVSKQHNSLELGLAYGEPVYNGDLMNGLEQTVSSVFFSWEPDDHWRLGTYWVSQTLMDVTDREAIGVRTSFRRSDFLSSLLIDYDIHFNELNSIVWNSNWSISKSSNLALVVGRQHSPMLTASNILIGQSDLDLDAYLQNKDNRDELVDDALLRTASNDYYSLVFNTRLDERLALNFVYHTSSQYDIPDYEALAGLPSSGTVEDSFDYDSMSAELLIEEFFGKASYTRVGARRSEATTSSANQVYLSSRFRPTDKVFIDARLALYQTEFEFSGQEQRQFRYSLNSIYRPFRSVELNFEIGVESVDQSSLNTTLDTRYIFAGYRWHF